MGTGVAPLSVALAWPVGASVSSLFLDSVVRLYEDRRTRRLIHSHVTWLGGPDLSLARNGIARSFLSSSADWLLTIDSDMAFTSEHVLALIAAADQATSPVVSGVYFGLVPGLADTHTVAECGRVVDDRLVFEAPPPGSIAEVDFVGAGFLFVHRSAFERIDDGSLRPWFAEDVLGGEPVAEDWGFCRRLRDHGIPIRVVGDVRPGHVKSIPISAETFTSPDGLSRANGPAFPARSASGWNTAAAGFRRPSWAVRGARANEGQ